MSGKEALHRLVDDLPESQWEAARQVLEDLRKGEPVDEDSLTPEEIAEIEKAREAVRRGEYITLEDYERERGL